MTCKKSNIASDIDSEICSEFWQTFFLTYILTCPWRLFYLDICSDMKPGPNSNIWSGKFHATSSILTILTFVYIYVNTCANRSGGKAHSPRPCYENARDMGPREAHNNNSSSSNSNSNADPTNIPQFTVFLGFPMRPFIIYNIFVILYPHFFFKIYLWSFTLMWAPGLLSGVSP